MWIERPVSTVLLTFDSSKVIVVDQGLGLGANWSISVSVSKYQLGIHHWGVDAEGIACAASCL